MKLENLQAAASDINQALLAAYRDAHGIHAETIVGAAAALAGEFALRASAKKIPAAGWVIGGAADELLYRGEEFNRITLWSFLKLSAKAAGVPVGEVPEIGEIVARTGAAVGSSPFPPLTISDAHYPHEWSPEAGPKFRHLVGRIAATHALTPDEIALSLAMVIMMLINQAKELVPPQILIRLAAEIMIGVSRMAPLPDDYQSSTVN